MSQIFLKNLGKEAESHFCVFDIDLKKIHGELLDCDLTLKLDVPHKALQFEILLDKSEEGYLLRALKERELAKMGVKKQ